MRGSRVIAAAVLVALALPVAGCGKDKPGIPRSDASELVTLLRAVERQTAKHGCTSVSRTISELQAKVETLPANTDPDVTATLRDGISNLRNLVASECATVKPKPKKPTTTTETQTTEPPTTAPPTTSPPTTSPPTTSPPTTSPPTTSPPSTSSGGQPSGGANGGNTK
jgi:hypothetical protein